MRVRNSAKCTVCGKTGKPLDAEGYVCKDCQKEKAQTTSDQDADEAAIEQIRKQTQAAKERPATKCSSSTAPESELAPALTAKATRRSISIKGRTDARLGRYARMLGKSKSAIIEELVHERLDAVGAPMPKTVDRPKRKQQPTRDFALPLIL